MRVIIDGGAGTGKSTVARAVAKKFKLRHVSAGMKFRELAKKMGYATSGEEYLKFHAYQKNHPEIDREFDESIIKYLKHGDLVIDSRIAGRLFKGRAFRILLKVPDEVAAKRNALRESVTKAEALRAVVKRNKEDGARYKKLYNIDLTDTSIYDLVLNTSYFSIKEMNSIILKIIGFLKL